MHVPCLMKAGQRRDNDYDTCSFFSTIGHSSLSLAWIPEAKRWLLLYTLG